ncbi:MAG TPA: hypothetical protein VET46_08860 [Steroidobacteraceae bacterium]|nr:hypothetical protein [Steroidobacteraceae bacterium]
MPAAEHIVLESETREIPSPNAARKVHARLELRSRLRRRLLQLKLIDYTYLAVHSRSGATALDYVLDLRFLDAAPGLSRRIAWRWIGASLILLAAVAATGMWIAASATPWWQHAALGPCAAVAGVWLLAMLVAAYRTTETVRLLSAHGRARLLEFTGGPGTVRAARKFLARLAAHQRLAAAARRPLRAEQLRDEMREHQRLLNLGVLSAAEYEASKARILAQH